MGCSYAFSDPAGAWQATPERLSAGAIYYRFRLSATFYKYVCYRADLAVKEPATMSAMLTGKKLKAIRALRGMTQAELAASTGVSPTAIAEFEKGKRDLRTDTVRKLCEALEVRVTYTVDGTEISGP
jgi:DNA-binding XRE family transcriptional regulator